MYIDSNIDSSFKYIAEIHENYVILVKVSYLDSNNTYDAVIQFFNPSSDYYIIHNYKPKFENATAIDYDFYYNSGSPYLYNSLCNFSQNCYQVDTDSDFFSRPDYMNIIIGVSSIVIFTSIILNCVTSLVIKGGLFNND